MNKAASAIFRQILDSINCCGEQRATVCNLALVLSRLVWRYESPVLRPSAFKSHANVRVTNGKGHPEGWPRNSVWHKAVVWPFPGL
ncbi:hypothetical protein FHS20_002945 [Phyllobacterium endophyticum]|nr:hypothetical protein [Phyllobacterium endophyticum]